MAAARWKVNSVREEEMQHKHKMMIRSEKLLDS